MNRSAPTAVALALSLAAPAAAQTLRFPADAIVLQEFYHGCELGQTQAFFNTELYPKLKVGLTLAYRNKAMAQKIHERTLKLYPTAVLIRIRVGTCGDPA